ncbi:4-alpha-glucanotransferase, chloroplastic/amyloplastic isoform X2 [Amborella trichopoda]|uniref:4-alpha-glucanotransferase, chloroplastic/amyloplastic isoform X2 n=1 Tax=Amborella trichopoda TaxID=13333 RepID=UPI0009BE96E5|nr:4-alpha-glucanotransferase, chloroplastic/amyloplastic isoform X2 [Amborella trichopoda]|eukprot:XP_020520381.1 4-alpha-glucanotransferase, chloroplastic/amyloplastic isoform X2 [Amborella trichopoda]
MAASSLSTALLSSSQHSDCLPILSLCKPNFRSFCLSGSTALPGFKAKGSHGWVSQCMKSFEVGADLPEDYGEWYPKKDSSERRRAGVFLHPSSFPGPYGVGDLGEQAFRFLDWLHSTGFSVWQVLPLVPPGRKSGEDGSPYAGQDANCGNTLLISLEELVKDGLLTKEELPEPMDAEYVRFTDVADAKDPLIAKAAKRLIVGDSKLKQELEKFRTAPEISGWLQDAALFAAIDNMLNTLSWCEWPEPLRNRHLAAMECVYQNQKEFIDIFIAEQFLFQRQWKKVHNYARKKGISIMGDMPIYVGYHSADVWANKSLFLLSRSGFPLLVSGVPPDAFSETGQLWGSPLYDWKGMEKDGFLWWIQRIKRAHDLFDEFRIDHFRGFTGYWAVPFEAKIAMYGRWKAGPGEALFDAIFKAMGNINIVAEDLGVITDDVVRLRKAIGAPGMAVLQFAFGSDSDNPHLPHNHEPDQVVYTGTHDNDTILGWWQKLKQEDKSTKYLHISDESDISWELIQYALSSVAKTTVLTMQDILGLDNSARMNIPATQYGNWRWRMDSSKSFDSLEPEAKKLRDMLILYNRLK